MEGYPEITKDNWNGGIQIETQPDTEGFTENMRSYRPFEMPYINIMGTMMLMSMCSIMWEQTSLPATS